MNYSQWAAVNVTWTPPDDEGPHVIAENILLWKSNRQQLFAKIWGHPNDFTLNTALPWVHSNTPTKCEADWINSCQEKQRVRTHTRTHTDVERDSFFYREMELLKSPVALKESEGSIICTKRLLWLTSSNTDSIFFFHIARCEFSISVDFKWPFACASSATYCSVTRSTGSSSSCYECLLRIAFLKSPGKCSYMEMYTMCCGLMWRANEVSKVSLI